MHACESTRGSKSHDKRRQPSSQEHPGPLRLQGCGATGRAQAGKKAPRARPSLCHHTCTKMRAPHSHAWPCKQQRRCSSKGAPSFQDSR